MRGFILDLCKRDVAGIKTEIPVVTGISESKENG
jgi:hypothetical protein